MSRIVLPELLDVLPPEDLSAQRSRRDLRRVNAWMAHARILSRVLRENIPAGESCRLVELGAGDGHFLLSVAKRVNGRWPGSQAVLVDRLNVLDSKVCDQFHRLGWMAKSEIIEVMEWLRRSHSGSDQAIISNLFFHQFEAKQLTEMLRLASAQSKLIVALEPRRSWLAKLCGRLLWLIGCGPVTMHDAHISIRAGFSGNELSELWPDKENWRLIEKPAGLFSHLFIARRKE